MKNFLLTSCFFLLIFQLNAQQIAVVTEPVISIPVNALNYENQKLRSDLSLTNDQLVAIKDITLERYKARQVVNEMFKYEPEKQAARLKEIDRQFDGEFAAVLDDKQYKKYLKLQGRDKEDIQILVGEAEKPKGPDFNAQIQALIQQATAPKLDTVLLPQQGDSSQDFADTDSLQQIRPAGFPGNSNTVSDEKLAIKENAGKLSFSDEKTEQEKLAIAPAAESPELKTTEGSLKPATSEENINKSADENNASPVEEIMPLETPAK